MMAFTQFEKISPPSLQHVRDKIMKKINLQTDQVKLNELSKLLNQIILNNSFEENQIATKLLNKIPQIIEQGGNAASMNYQIDGKLKVYTTESNAAWNEYSTLLQNYKNAIDSGMNELSLKADIEAAYNKAQTLQGALNNLQGQAFESLLQVLLPLIKDGTQNTISSTIDELLKIVDSSSSIATKGSENDTISLIIENELVKITSQGKIDVIAQSPFIHESDIMKISAKNYSKLRDIYLLSGGSAVGLISQWQANLKEKNYYYNALGVWYPENYLQEARLTFALQSLVGRGDGELANILILNIRSRKNPISVISIKSLLQGIEQNPIKDQNPFNLILNSLPIFTPEDGHRTPDEYRNRVKTITVDSSLNKAYLQLKYMSQLKS